MRQARMMAFHVRQFVTVPYFVQLMVFTTLTTTVVQYLAAHAWGGIDPTAGWIRGGIIGMWTTSTCAAGIIGFERFKGTLVHLVMAPRGVLHSLAAVVSAAASFGLFALPTAWLTWAIVSGSVNFTAMSWEVAARLVFGGFALWAGCLALSFVIAAVFVLTPNAISYEGLLLVPVFIASGIVFTSSTPPGWLTAVGRGIPLTVPVNILYGEPVDMVSILSWFGCVACWFLAAGLLGNQALRLATRAGTLELV